MEIRIRHIEATKSMYLNDGRMEDATDLMSQIRVHGCHVDGNTEYACIGQFCITDDGAYFEIIVGEDK